MVKVAPNHYLVQFFPTAISMSVYKVYTSDTPLSNMVLSAHFLSLLPPPLSLSIGAGRGSRAAPCAALYHP